MVQTIEPQPFVGVPKSRALIVIPQPPRRRILILRAMARVTVRAAVLPVVLLAVGVRMSLRAAVSVGRLAIATPRVIGGYAAQGVASIAQAAQPVLLALWIMLVLGARTVCTSVAKFVRGALMASYSVLATAALGLLQILVLGGRAAVALGRGVAASGRFAARGCATAGRSIVRGCAAAGRAVVRGCAAAGLAIVRGCAAAGRAVARWSAAALRVVAGLCARIALALARGTRRTIAATARLALPADGATAIVVAATVYFALVAANFALGTLAHPLLAVATAVLWVLAAAYSVAAVRGHAPKTPGLFALAGMTIGGAWLVASATLALGVTWIVAAAIAVTLLALNATLRCAGALAVAAPERSDRVRRCHRDAALGLAIVVLAQTAVAVLAQPAWSLGTAVLQICVIAAGGWLAHAVGRGVYLGLAQLLLFGGAATALVLGAIASFQAFGQGRAFSAASIAYAALLTCIAVALALIVRVRIADGTYRQAGDTHTA